MKEELDKINDTLMAMNQTLVRHDENLKEHMRRTELAERALEKITESLKPLHRHVHHVEGGLKLLGIVSLLIGIWAGIVSLL